ncbi:MAG: M28 family peptidase [Pseudomonadales bacterium]|nr:M28 family peptidase [Pseudomonadales bacterium]
MGLSTEQLNTSRLRKCRVVISLIAMTLIPPVTLADVISGFDDVTSETQLELESRYDSDLEAAELDAWLRELSSRPHHVGSAAGYEVAKRVHDLLQSWGYETEFADYEVLLPTPKVRELELIAPQQFTAALREDSVTQDPSTSVRDNLLPPYNAFSIDGEVEAELVFVNYGIPEDYELLERYGISVAGKIVIAKYGRSWRGIKPKLAAEKGAIGALIYSDPGDDGYGAGDTYPEGPFKHASGVQRGSVMDMPTYPGDVLTPGRGATKRAKRLARTKVEVITKIPVLPISWRDAEPLLTALGGEAVPKDWRGALPITYHFGPGPARVRLKVEFNWDMVTARNVIARLPGSEYPDQWVIRGNHHDGWNHGAADPISGLVAMLAEAKSVAALARSGSPPKRTIIYAAWDAEEQGLIGSTEWAEHHAQELKQKAVAYINTDGNSRGFVGVGGSHSLETMFNEITDKVRDPVLDVSVKERLFARLKLSGNEQQKKDLERQRLRISPLGSGSDYTPFLQHLGIASANLGFYGEGSGGSYHTLYDTYEHYTTWRDPGLTYGITLAQLAGRVTLRLANAPVLPFEFGGLTDNIELYIQELEVLAEKMRKDTDKANELIGDGVYGLALDPTKSLGPPKEHEPVPYFNFAPLQNSLASLKRAVTELKRVQLKGSATLNQKLFTTERLLTLQDGLPNRPWYKHHIYAPGFYTGYGVKTLPGVREAIEQREYDKVADEVQQLVIVLDGLAQRIREITEIDSE